MAMTITPPGVGWIAWFTFGRVFCSLDIEWKALPESGVLMVIVYGDRIGESTRRGRTLFHGRDNYVRLPCGGFFLTDDPVRALGAQVKSGTMVSDQEMEKVRLAALAATWLG